MKISHELYMKLKFILNAYISAARMFGADVSGTVETLKELEAAREAE